MGSPGVIDQNWLNQAAQAQAAAANANTGSGAPGAGPAGAQFGTPVQQSGWTGVSSAQDPYGIHNIGYDMGTLQSGTDSAGKPLYNLGRDVLTNASGYGTNNGPGGTPLFSGYSKYENQNAQQGDPFTGGPSTSAWAAQQGAVSQGNLAAQAAQTNPTDPATGGYPAYPNSYGIGNSGGLGGAPSAPPAQTPSSYSQNGVTVNVPDSSSRGLGPWGLVGESNARDSSKGIVPQGPS